MKLKFAPLAAIVLLAVFFTSCSDKSNIPVPVDAGFVFHINGKSLNEKLSWDEVKQSEWYKMAYEEVKDDLAKKILDNPENSGIDIKSDAYFFVRSGGGGTYTAFTCSIKDEKAFGEFISKVTEGETPKKDGNISMIAKGGSVISWSKDRFAAVMNAPDANPAAGAFDMDGGRRKSYNEDSLIVFAKNIYSIKGKKSIGSNSKFSSLMKENGDAHLWVNAGAMYGNSMPAMLAITKVSLLFEGNVSAATINFENGKIVLDAKNYYNKELAALYKKYSMKDIDPAIFKKIPSGDVAAVIGMNYPPEGLKEFVGLLGVDGLLNMFLAKENFSIDDFIKANKGDILLAVSDFKMQKQTMTIDGDTYNYSQEKPEAKILFGASINDRASFDKMLNLFNKKIAEEGGMAAEEMTKKIPYAIKDNWFLAGSDSAYLNSFGAASTDHPFISKVSGHPLAGFIDIQKFINGSRPVMDSAGTLIADQAVKVWENIIFYGGEYKGDATISHAEINFVDKNTNSLKQLNNFISFMVVQEREKMKRFNDDIMTPDSVIVVPAPAPIK